MLVIYEEINNRRLHSCEEEQCTVKNNKEILNCDNCLGNTSFYIWIERDSQHISGRWRWGLCTLAAAWFFSSVLPFHSDPSRQLSTLTLPFLTFFTPVAALSKNPGQTSSLLPETVQICILICSLVNQAIGNATICQHATNVHIFITGVKCRLTSNLLWKYILI